jgi:hypothetical protein
MNNDNITGGACQHPDPKVGGTFSADPHALDGVDLGLGGWDARFFPKSDYADYVDKLSEMERSVAKNLAHRGREVLEAGEFGLIRGGQGVGKSYVIQRIAIDRYVNDLRTVIAAPTIATCLEYANAFWKTIPEAYRANQICLFFDARGAGGPYVIKPYHRIIITTHAQLLYHGFSRYLGPIYPCLVDQALGGTDPPALIIDEMPTFLRMCEWEVPLFHRRQRRRMLDGKIKEKVITDCPFNARFGRCSNCSLEESGGTTDEHPEFPGLRVLKPPSDRLLLPDGQATRPDLGALSLRPADFDLGKKIQISNGVFAQMVRGCRFSDPRASQKLVSLSECDANGSSMETMQEIIAHRIIYSSNVIMVTHHAVDGEGKVINSQTLSSWMTDPADRHRSEIDDVTFPTRTCECPTLVGLTTGPLTKIRELQQRIRMGVLAVGPTVSRYWRLLEKAVPDLRSYDFPRGNRRIKQVAIGILDGKAGDNVVVSQRQDKPCTEPDRQNVSSTTEAVAEETSGGGRKLVTFPLEKHGRLNLIFVKNKNSTIKLMHEIQHDHPTAQFVIEQSAYEAVRANTPLRQEPVKTLVTYPRGILSMGVNLQDVSFVYVDGRAFRPLYTFPVAEMTSAAFRKSQAEDLLEQILQAIGRCLRGNEDKLAAIVIGNADARLIHSVRKSQAITQAGTRPMVTCDGEDLPQMVDRLDRWLIAGGGAIPPPDERKRSGTKKGRPRGHARTEAGIIKRAYECMTAGKTWAEFNRTVRPGKSMSRDRVAKLKADYKSGVLSG